MFTHRSKGGLIKKTASILLAVFLSIPPFAHTAFASEADSSKGNALAGPVDSNSGTIVGSVNKFNGSFEYSYPITVPPGRNGLSPDVTLMYSSANGDDHDVFGYGWNVSIPYISRLNKTGIEKLYSDDYYFSSLSGELVQIGTTDEYRAKVENGDFLSYELNNDVWIVTDKNGTEYTFGSTTVSRQDNPSDSTEIYKWMINEVRDTNDNFISYDYFKDQGQIYPEEINYTGNGITDGVYEISFERATRTTSFKNYFPGFSVTTAHSIDRIEVLTDGTWTRRYDIDYINGHNLSRQLVDDITETGNGDDGTIALPATNFTYGTQDENLLNNGSDWNLGLNGAGSNDDILFYDEDESETHWQSTFADMNGDGMVDIAGRVVRYTNDGDEFDLNSTSSFPTDEYFDFEFGRTRAVDINGDQFADLVQSLIVDASPNEYIKKVYLNDGSGNWTSSSTWANSLPDYFATYTEGGSGSYYDYGFQFGDMNGDGLLDLVKDGDIGSLTKESVYLNTGSGFASSTNWASSYFVNVALHYRLGYLVDVNNDGLSDIVSSWEDENTNTEYKKVLINTGDDLVLDTTFSNSLPDVFVEADPNNYDAGQVTDFGFRFADVNSDGLPDLVKDGGPNTSGASNAGKVYINDGSEWTEDTSWSMSAVSGVMLADDWAYLGDFNGDTLVDLAVATRHNNQILANVYPNTGDEPDVIHEVETPEGGTITVTYKGSAEEGDTSGSRDNPDLPFSLRVVDTITYDNDFGDSWIETVSYADGEYYYSSSDVLDRTFAGFGKVTTEDDLSKEINYFHQNNGVSTASEEGSDSEALIGRVYRTDVSDTSGDEYKVSRYNYDTASLGDGATFVKLGSVLSLDYDGDADEKAAATSYTYSNTHGSILTKTEWGEVDGDTDGTFSDIGLDDRKTEFEYATNTSGLVLPSEITLEDDSGTKVSESRFYYDNQSLGSVTDGNLTKQENWVSGSSYVDREWTYDSYGNVLSETDPRGHVTNYEYDDEDLFVASTTNAEGHNTKFEYDYSSGLVATTTDVNDEEFVTIYDALDRPTEEYIPDPQTGNQVLVSEYSYTDTRGALRVLTTNHLSSTTDHVTYTYLDGFGSMLQERVEAEGTNEYIVRDFVYGDNGLLEKESLPYFSSGASRTTATTSADLLSTYTYDALARVTAVSTAVGTSSTAYDQWRETVTDTAGNEKEFKYDAFGRLIRVTEEEGINSYETDYDWDDSDNLIKVTDANGNVRNISYDGLNRRTNLEDLHDPNDTSFGEWDFTYDASGNVSSLTDPNDQTINYTYDDINRVLTEDYTGESGTEVTYTYDLCANGVGLLCSAANDDVTTTYTYTPNGLLESEGRLINGTTSTSTYEYDRLGNNTLLTYPDSSEVRYTYNKANQVEGIEQRESGGTFADILEDVDYGPHGQIEYLKYGNAVETTRTYDATELYRLSNITTTASSTYGTGGPGAELAAIEAALAELPVLEIVDETEVVSEEVVEEIVEETVAEDDEVPEEVVVESVEEEVVETASSSEPEVIEETSSSTDIVIEDTATTTEESVEIVFDVPTTTEQTAEEEVDLLSTPVSETTPEIIEEPKAKKVKKSKVKANINDAHDARMLLKYHRERLAALQELDDIDKKTLEAAQYGHDELEKYLIEEEYLSEPGAAVKGYARDKVKREGKKLIERVIDIVTPEEVSAYLFGTEDFESCSSLPCSFDSDVSWGSVTPSLDSTGQIEGDDSLKEVVTGAGGGGLELADQDEDEIYVQFKTYIPSGMTWGPSGFHNILRMEDSSNNTVFWMTVEDWGTARLTMMGDALPWTNTGIDLTKGAVNTIEVRFKKGSSDGDVDIWVDNTTEGSPDYDGSGSLNTGTDNVDDVVAGVTYAPETISTTYFDDIVVDTAFIGTLATDPTTPFAETVQDLTYTYDSVGNITKIVDDSDTVSEITIDYTYDDLYRLTNASSSNASTTNYNETYTYNAIGNILTKSGVGTYSYEGDGSTGGTYSLYDDSVASGWSDWSWFGSIDPSSTSTVYDGNNSIEASFTSAWGGLAYHHSGSFDSSPYEDIELAVNVGSNTSVDLYLYFNDETGSSLTIKNLDDYNGGSWSANTWETLSVPLTDLGFDDHTGSTTFHIESSQAVTINYDKIEFTGGTTVENYANPHAATSIDGVTQTYDENGNLASTSDGLSNTWNYRNELTQSVTSNGTTSYGYDHDGTRVWKDDGTTKTYYPFSNYEVTDTGTTTKHIYMDDMLVATVEGSGAGALTYHNHLDHLGSTRAVTDGIGALVSELDYFPYGDTRIDNEYGDFRQHVQHTGHQKDDSTGLIYRKARYYDGETGRFTSMDPYVFKDLTTIINDPQLLNTYGYARNNPLIYNDPNGELPALAPVAVLAIRAALIGAGFGVVEQGTSDVITTVATGETHVSSPGEYVESAAIGGATLGVSKYLGPSKGIATFVGGTYASNVNHGSEAPLAETAVDTALMLTGGKYTEGLRKVPGRDVSTFSDRFFTGSHTRELIRNTSVETGVTSAGRAVTAGAGVYIDSSGAVQYSSDGFSNSQSTPQRVEDKDKDR